MLSHCDRSKTLKKTRCPDSRNSLVLKSVSAGPVLGNHLREGNDMNMREDDRKSGPPTEININPS